MEDMSASSSRLLEPELVVSIIWLENRRKAVGGRELAKPTSLSSSCEDVVCKRVRGSDELRAAKWVASMIFKIRYDFYNYILLSI